MNHRFLSLATRSSIPLFSYSLLLIDAAACPWFSYSLGAAGSWGEQQHPEIYELSDLLIRF